MLGLVVSCFRHFPNIINMLISLPYRMVVNQNRKHKVMRKILGQWLNARSVFACRSLESVLLGFVPESLCAWMPGDERIWSTSDKRPPNHQNERQVLGRWLEMTNFHQKTKTCNGGVVWKLILSVVSKLAQTEATQIWWLNRLSHPGMVACVFFEHELAYNCSVNHITKDWMVVLDTVIIACGYIEPWRMWWLGCTISKLEEVPYIRQQTK